MARLLMSWVVCVPQKFSAFCTFFPAEHIFCCELLLKKLFVKIQ
jgi:hypothetical protein